MCLFCVESKKKTNHKLVTKPLLTELKEEMQQLHQQKKKKKKETGAELSDLLVTYAEYICVSVCVWAHVCVRQSQRKKQSA